MLIERHMAASLLLSLVRGAPGAARRARRDDLFLKVISRLDGKEGPVLHHVRRREVEPVEGSALQEMAFELHHDVAQGIKAYRHSQIYLIHVEVNRKVVEGGVTAAVAVVTVYVVLIVIGAELHPVGETIGRAHIP